MTRLEHDPRRAGELRRYHTWQTIQQQNVAAHTWQVVRILLAIWPDAPREVIVHAQFHDVGELATGDMPFPIKRDNPALKAVADGLEEATLRAMSEEWMVPLLENSLSDVERRVVKLAEFVEMWEFGLVELELGNRTAADIVERCRRGFCVAMEAGVGEEIGRRAVAYVTRRAKHHEDIMRRRI